MSAPGPRVVIVGLGPGGRDHVTRATEREIAVDRRRFVRTVQHPTADLVDGTSFDDLYDRADEFGGVYDEIRDRLVAAALADGEVLYAVPGSPLVLEHTVALLRSDRRIRCEIHPAMSFLDLVWARLGLDPVDAGVRLVDGHRFATEAAGASGPLLVAHTHADWVLSDIKLSVDDADIDVDDTEVTLLCALGTDQERIVTTTWAEMDRAVDADHLTSLYVPHLHTSPGAGYIRFHELARTLRERCPWDVEQTHQSLRRYLVEETFEVVDAIDALDPDDTATDEALAEELGDLLYQIEFHATIAEQEGRFTIADVTQGIHDKLVRRHPHVFGDVDTDDPARIAANWEAIKRAEKGRTSVFDGVARSLPALGFADEIQRKAAKVGFDWPDVDGALAKVGEEAVEVTRAAPHEQADELGDLLFAVVNVARHLGVEPELALRAATRKFVARFEQVEALAAERGIDLGTSDLAVLDALWDEIKASGH